MDLTSSQCLPEGTSLQQTLYFLAPNLFGTNAGWFLLGFILVQTYTFYYTHSARHHPLFKFFVYASVFLAIAEAASDGYVSYYILVLGWGDPLLLSKFSIQEAAASAQSNLLPAFAVIPAVFVQSFFTWRIWKFCMAVCKRRTKLLVALVCFFILSASITAAGAALYLTVEYFILPIQTPASQVIATLWPMATAVADVTITVCMMAILFHAKSSAYFGETRDKITRLLRVTVQTGFLTSIIALPIVPLGLIAPIGNLFTLPMFLLGRSYVITLLANLNLSLDHNSPVANTDSSVVLSTVQITPGRTINNSNGTDIHQSGIVSFLRSFARTIRDDLSSEPR